MWCTSMILKRLRWFGYALVGLRQRIRSRAELRGLDTRMLRDIGLRREDALREANKPFWRA